MSKLFDYGESLEKKTESVLKDCEVLMGLAFKASGTSFMDTISDLDAESRAMFGGYMKLYKKTKELAVMQAKTMDKMLGDLDKLKEMNEILYKQNETLQQTLQNFLFVKSTSRD